MGTGSSFLEGKEAGREFDHSLHPMSRSKKEWSYTSTSQYIFMAWYLVKHRDNSTFTFTCYSNGWSECVAVTEFVIASTGPFVPQIVLNLFVSLRIWKVHWVDTKCLRQALQHVMKLLFYVIYEGSSKSFRTGRLEQELQMVQFFASRCNGIAILWVSLVSSAAITLCVASQGVFVVDFVIDSVRKLLDTPCILNVFFLRPSICISE
jgi:hypothetical protein